MSTLPTAIDDSSAAGDNPSRCAICKAVLGSTAEHRDLGGDCLMCMAACDDPDAMAELERMRNETTTSNPDQ